MQDNQPTGSWQVLSFPPSNDCDLACWSLEHYGISYRDARHTLPWLALKAKSAGGKGDFPTVANGKVALNNLDEVFDYFEPRVPADKRLLPEDGGQQAEVKKLWEGFHKQIGYAAAQWAYYYLLPSRSLMAAPFAAGCPWYEKLWVQLTYPLLAGVVRKGIGITGQTLETAMPVILSTLDDVDKLLSDGQPFLVGDRPTIADFGFAAMAVPLIWPPEFGGALPEFERIPSVMKDKVLEWRQRPSGLFTLRMYKDYRHKSG
ncbi:MAG: glutathione S-transferase C-terminal domain-containing protein [Planctomycetota bacterium]